MNTDFNYLAEILMTKLYPQIYLPLRENSFSYSLKTVFHWFSLLPPVYVVRWEGNVLTLSVYLSTWRGVPGLRFSDHIITTSLPGGGGRVPHHFHIITGGVPHHYHIITGGGYHITITSLPGGGGVPGLSKGKIFWHQIWLHTCSHGKKIFFPRDPPPPVKGKFFDTRFGFIHVQMGKKIFSQGTPCQ